MLLSGLRQVVAQQPGYSVAGEACTGAGALSQAAELAPDLIIMDVHLPDMIGIEATRRLREILPCAKIVVFSGDAARSLVDDALQAGASGYIWKLSAIEELVRAMKMVMAGQVYISPEVSAGILEDYRRGLTQPEPAKPLLTERDKQLLRLVAQGLRNKEIALELGLSPKSVEAYRSRLMKRVGCSNSAELVRYAVREGIAAA